MTREWQCQVEYDLGSRYRPQQVVSCRRRAVAVIDGLAVCATHAPKLLRITNRNAKALADLAAAGIFPEEESGV